MLEGGGWNYWLVSGRESPTLCAMALWADLGFVWRRFVRTARAGWMVWLGRVLTFMVLTGVVLFPNDLKLLHWVQVPEGWDGAQKFFGFWGDFLQFSIGVGIVLLIAGALVKDRWLRRGAIAFVMAGVMSGATTWVGQDDGRAGPAEDSGEAFRTTLFEFFRADNLLQVRWLLLRAHLLSDGERGGCCGHFPPRGLDRGSLRGGSGMVTDVWKSPLSH